MDAGKGSDPEWNEHFVFTVSEGVSELTIKIMDSDSGSADDFVGEAWWVLVPVLWIFSISNVRCPIFILIMIT